MSSRASRDRRVVKQWVVDGSPRALAAGVDGTLYVGLSGSQEILALDPDSGKILQRKQIDHAEIAATKDFVSMRLTADGDRLVIAHGSDESVTIHALPELGPVREIGLEGELVRDAVPAPDGSFVAVLGRDVHIWSRDGGELLRVLRELEPMALAVSSDGSTLAVVGRESYPSGTVSVAILFDTATWSETFRRPLETERSIRGAAFAADDSVLAVWTDDWIAEVAMQAPRSTFDTSGETARVRIAFGDLVSSEAVCLPERTGPQIATLAGRDRLVFAERRCSASGSMTGTRRKLRTISLTGVEAWSIAWDRTRELVVASDPRGTITMYSLPASADR